MRVYKNNFLHDVFVYKLERRVCQRNFFLIAYGV